MRIVCDNGINFQDWIKSTATKINSSNYDSNPQQSSLNNENEGDMIELSNKYNGLYNLRGLSIEVIPMNDYRPGKADALLDYVTFTGHADGSVTSDENEILNKFRQSGMNKEIDWNRVNQGFSFSLYETRWNFAPGTTQAVGERLAAQYAVVKERINRNYTGVEQEDQLSLLEKTFAKYLDEFALTCAQNINNSLGDFDMENGQDIIYEEAKAALEQQTEEYSRFINNNSDYASIKGTEDEWLKDHDGYMASELRYAFDKKANSYENKIDSIEKLSKFAWDFQKISNDIIGNGSKSEEEMGFRLGLAAIKLKNMSVDLQLPSDFSNELENGLSNYFQSRMKKENENIADLRDHFGTAQTFPELNQERVLEIVNTMLNDYNDKHDFMHTFNLGIQKGYQLFKNRHENNPAHIYRYDNDSFWKNITGSKVNGGYTVNIKQELLNLVSDCIYEGKNSGSNYIA